MERPFPAYSGEEPYVFVSYAHKDASAVYPELKWLRKQGFHIWFDEGIEAGSEWREEIGKSILGATAFLYFVSDNSVQSENCRKEISLADKQEIPIIAIHLRDAKLTAGLDLILSDRQAILKYQLPRQEYQEKLQTRIADFLNQPVLQPLPERRRTSGLFVAISVAVIAALSGWFVLTRQGIDFDAPMSSMPQKDQTEAKSIAVLPFTNISSNQQQDYFADGLSEELLNLLARVPGLKVAARTSSYAFKGKNEDLRTIGATLGVDQVLEGSVRRSGNRVRVTAQLVKVEDGFHIWSETYDREITELFSIQDDIASAITAALQVRLGVTMPKPATPTQNMESYALYLEARSLRLAGKNSEAIATLEKAISLDPDFAEAHMLAAQIFFDAPLPGFGEDMRYKLSEQHAVTARTLAPESVVAGALARVISVSRARRSTGEPMWDEYQDALRTAYTAESGDSQMRSQMRNWASWNYLTLGYFQRALSLADETIALDPLFMNAQMARLLALTGLGRSEEAQQVSELLMRNTGDYRGLNFRALISLANGDAAAAELLIEEFVDHRWGETDIIRAYLDSIIDPKTRDAAFQSNQWSMFMGATVGQVMYVLRDERLFTRLLSGKEFMPLAWAMPLRSSWFLNHPRFRAVAERRHAPYWQKHELPDFCNGNFDSWICELPVSVGNE